jgi:WD40 repeat protein
MSEITDIAVNYENTLLASGDISNLILIWSLKSAKLLTSLKSHTKQITSLKFCPLSRTEKRYLVSTGDDGRVCFWKWNVNDCHFEPNPEPQIIERHRRGSGISCCSFSSGGHLLAVGSTDSYVVIYSVCIKNGPKKIFERKQHWGHVDRYFT